MKKFIAVMALGVVFFGGTGQAAPPSDVFFVVMGGRTSCGSGAVAPQGVAMYRHFLGMLKKLKTKFPEQKFNYLVSCLDTSPPPDGEAQFITSHDPNEVHTGNAEELLRQTSTYSGTEGNRATFVIGHSYGGWLAMYLGQNLRMDRQIAGLFTIDPVSPNCGPAGVVFGSEACHEAPTELDNATIRRQTKRWVNFYQTQDPWISSGPVPEAENFHLDYRGPHTKIDIDPRTWSTIETAVKQALAE